MTDISLFTAIGAVITLAAVFGYLNHRFLRLPPTIGVVVIALVASLGTIGIDAVVPSLGIGGAVRTAILGIDFHEVLMKGMLSFLLFAGALHVNLGDLLSRKWAIGSIATVGVVLSTFLVGFAVYGVTQALGLPLALIYCLVFGALIAPTDPIAVLGILKTVKVPASLQAKIAGESLFNDGVGIVVFIIMTAIAVGSAHGGCQRRLKLRPKGGAKDCHLGWWSELGVRLGVGDAVRGFFGGSGQRSHAELKRSAPAARPQGGMVCRVGVSLATRASGARCRPGPGDGVPQFSYQHCFCGRGFG